MVVNWNYEVGSGLGEVRLPHEFNQLLDLEGKQHLRQDIIDMADRTFRFLQWEQLIY